MARKKKLSTEELGKNREDLIGQWREIAQQVKEIDDELSSRELKENYDKKHLKEIQNKYTGKIIMLKNKGVSLDSAYSLDFYEVKKIVPDSADKFNIIGKYINLRRDGILMVVNVGTKTSIYPYLGLQSYKAEKDFGYEIYTPKQMLDVIKQFKERIEMNFQSAVNILTNDYLTNVTKKLPKKSKKPLTKKK